MSKTIELEALSKYEEEYLQDTVQTVARRALAKHSVADIAFVGENEWNTTCQFSIDIPTMSATSQNASGRCWLFAGMNVLREIVAKKCHIPEFELSQNYIAFYDKLEKINFMMESCIELKDAPKDDRTLVWLLQTGIQDGGQWDMIVSLVKKYGLVPKSAMPESFQSSNTRAMNGLINQRLRKFNAKIRTMTDSEIAEYKEETLKELYGMLCTCFGLPPKTFTFEYVDEFKQHHYESGLDPHSFYDKYIGVDLDDYISLIHAPTDDKPFNHVFTVDYIGNVVGGNPVTYFNVEMDELKAIVLKQLKDREIVWFGSDCSKFGDREKGLWDPNMYDYNTTFGIDFDMTKEEMMDNRHSAMNHAMVITGVNLVDGTPTKWKIENSWGPDRGHKGYYVASDAWFDLLVYQVVVNKKYLSDEQKAMLESDPIHLHPWDPMGTLAD